MFFKKLMPNPSFWYFNGEIYKLNFDSKTVSRSVNMTPEIKVLCDAGYGDFWLLWGDRTIVFTVQFGDQQVNYEIKFGPTDEKICSLIWALYNLYPEGC